MNMKMKSVVATQAQTQATSLESIKWIARNFFFTAAFVLALFPSVMKIYETSHWFREGDPSVYDNAKDWFSNPAIPFQSYFDNSKTLMRVYFFIIPYIMSASCVTLGLCIPYVPSPYGSSHMLQRPRRVFGSFLRRTIHLPSFLQERVSVAEVIGTLLFLTLNILTIAVRVRRSLPRGSRKIEFLVDIDDDASREAIEPVSWQACEVWAKTLGVVSILNLGWYLLMPVGRKSVLLEALNISWERAIKYHRWVGYWSVLIMITHSIMYVCIWVYGDGHPNYDPDGIMVEENMVPWYCSTNECTEDQARMLRINMYGFVTLSLIIVMTVFTLPWIRRTKFEWFYYTHHLFILVLVFVSLHYKGAIMYLLPGIAIYGVDKIMALYAYHKAAPVATKMLSSDVLEISFKTSPGVSYNAGDYIFLNVPAVSFLEWHPYSITSSPSVNGSSQTVFFHIKDAGSWTKEVINEAKLGNALKVRVDGFYGVNNGICEQLSSNKDGVILVGGGIGVTPMMSLGLELAKTKGIRVTLFWVVRTVEELGIFSAVLVNAKREYNHFDAKAWITLSDLEPGEKQKLIKFEDFNEASQSFKETSWLFNPPKNDSLTLTIKSSPFFVLDQPGLSGASNAAMMTLSTIFALVAFALSAQMSNGDKDTIQDFVSLMELAMVSVFVIVWVMIVIIARRNLHLAKQYQERQRDLKLKPSVIDNALNNTRKTRDVDGTVNTGDLNDTISTLPAGDLNDTIAPLPTISSHGQEKLEGDVESDIEKDQHDIEVFRSIVEGNIGCRPNIPNEFSKFASEVGESLDRPAHIAVLACGPPKLLESINQYVNVPDSACSLVGGKNQDAVFSFVEEDWEW